MSLKHASPAGQVGWPEGGGRRDGGGHVRPYSASPGAPGRISPVVLRPCRANMAHIRLTDRQGQILTHIPCGTPPHEHGTYTTDRHGQILVLNARPETRNPKPEPRSPTPQTPKHKTTPPNPTPQPLNSQPQAPNQGGRPTTGALWFRVSGFGYRIAGFGFRISGFGFDFSWFRVQDFGFWFHGFLKPKP